MDGIKIMITIIVFIIFIFDIKYIFDSGYKSGQIDAINGKIQYELLKQDDNTTKWGKIK